MFEDYIDVEAQIIEACVKLREEKTSGKLLQWHRILSYSGTTLEPGIIDNNPNHNAHQITNTLLMQKNSLLVSISKGWTQIQIIASPFN